MFSLDVLCFRHEGGLRSSSVGDARTVSRLPASALQERLVLLLQTAGQTRRFPLHPVRLHPTPEPRWDVTNANNDWGSAVNSQKHTQLYWIDLKRSDSSINTKSITNNSDDQLIVILNTNGQISVPAAQIWGFPGFLTLAVVESRIGRLMEIISSCSPNIEQYGPTYSMILIISDW